MAATAHERGGGRLRCRVICFDPSRFALQCYEKSFASDKRVTFENQGLSSESGDREFYDYQNMSNSLAPRSKEMPSGTPTIYRVPVTTIDRFCVEHSIDRINLMKIDAEGYDLSVLEGARKLFANQ